MLVNKILKFPLMASLGACLRFKETKEVLLFCHELLELFDQNYTVTFKLLVTLTLMVF